MLDAILASRRVSTCASVLHQDQNSSVESVVPVLEHSPPSRPVAVGASCCVRVAPTLACGARHGLPQQCHSSRHQPAMTTGAGGQPSTKSGRMIHPPPLGRCRERPGAVLLALGGDWPRRNAKRAALETVAAASVSGKARDSTANSVRSAQGRGRMRPVRVVRGGRCVAPALWRALERIAATSGKKGSFWYQGFK